MLAVKLKRAVSSLMQKLVNHKDYAEITLSLIYSIGNERKASMKAHNSSNIYKIIPRTTFECKGIINSKADENYKVQAFQNLTITLFYRS
jgi:hypothetical protein